MTRLEAPPVLYDRDDFIALRNKLRPRLWILLVPVAVLLSLMAVCILLIFYLLYREVLWREAIVSVIAILLLIVIVFLIPRLTVAAQMASAKRSGVLVPQHFSIDEEGWRAVSTRGEVLTRWPAVQRVELDRDRLFVFIGKAVAFILPRRVFDSGEDFQAFATAATTHWREHHRL